MKFLKKFKKSIDKNKLLDSSERYENSYYEFLRQSMDRLVQGFFIFKIRKGELLAGASTFFVLLTLSPLLLLIITMYGKLVGDVGQAYNHVMLAIKEGMPQLAPWIFESIQKIIKAQLSKDSLNTVNIILLLYTGAGLSSTLVFGMNNIADANERGGWLIETFKSALSAVFITLVITVSLVFTFQSNEIVSLVESIPVLGFIMKNASGGPIQFVMFLVLLTLYYMFITSKKIRISDGIFGGLTTIFCIMAAKSFYWIYVHYMKAELVQSFGNFYTLIVAVLYIYFMICSFFFGAATAYAPSYKRKKREPREEDVKLPELPKTG